MGILSWLGFGRTGVGLTDSGFWRWWANNESNAGKSVTADSAMQLATVWACVRLISETVATLPLGLYQKDTAGRRTTVDSPLYTLLHDTPNADQTAVEFWEGQLACLCLWGNGYSRKELAGLRTTALTPLRPDLMVVERNRQGERRYKYHDPSGLKEYGEDEIFHLKGFGVGGDVGLSPVSYARHSFGAAMATDEAAARTFSNGMRLGGVLTMDQVLKPEQRAQAQENIVKPFAGLAKTGGTMLLEAGMKYQPVTMNPDDAQMLQTRSFHVEEICRWFRVPPFMVGHTEKSTSWGTGLEQQMIGFLTFSLRPYLTRVEQAVKKSLLTPADRGRGVYAEFNLEGLLRADSQGRSALYSTFAQNAIMTRNEIRGKENLPQMPGGDVLTAQSNLVPLDQLGATDAAAAAQARNALRAWLTDGPETMQ